MQSSKALLLLKGSSLHFFPHIFVTMCFFFFNYCSSSSSNYILTLGLQSLETTVTHLVSQFLQAKKQYAFESWSTSTGKRGQAAVSNHRRMDRN